MQYFIILWFSIFAFQVNGQTITRDVFSNGGLSSQDGNISISSTLGESIDNVLKDNTVWLKQGFEQPIYDTLIATLTFNNTVLDLTVYPIPTKNFITLKITGITQINFQYSIVDITGRQHLKGQIFKESNYIDLQSLAAGMYILQIHDLQNTTSQSIKIQKIK